MQYPATLETAEPPPGELVVRSLVGSPVVLEIENLRPLVQPPPFAQRHCYLLGAMALSTVAGPELVEPYYWALKDSMARWRAPASAEPVAC